ncbi:S-4TM family putative pore-forming effector [Actinobacillus equuli]|uniref:SMODS and SLOG-associating 2TM effector domain-containing protein n=1 Tax=Actinobacillus equuli TaxID=718 RepID=A0AAX3FIF1_ACTEU|nr:S-4TM family putative pore-forming effector [Actinobacillus equuli]WGE43864.1 S-4TM family putative pore-forming effector [Actinobacillus equuli subsp. equuli]VEE90584.1 Uncharacterised protein [Actinobacillus equuli]
MVDIFSKQNEEWYLNRLVAQRVKYSESKNFRICENVFLIIAILIELLQYLPFTNIASIQEVYFNIAATFFIALSLVMGYCATSRQEYAAEIQQEFDCSLFNISYSGLKKFIDDDINKIVIKAEKRDYSIKEQVRNWYSDSISNFNYPYSALACQYQNIGWNRNLSQKYLSFLKWIFCSLVIIILAIGSYSFFNSLIKIDSLTINNLWGGGIIAFGLLKHLGGKIFSLGKSIKDKTEFLEQENNVFSNIKNNDINQVPEILKRIQMKIFEFRKNDKPIPDIFYKCYRFKEEVNSRKRLDVQ